MPSISVPAGARSRWLVAAVAVITLLSASITGVVASQSTEQRGTGPLTSAGSACPADAAAADAVVDRPRQPSERSIPNESRDTTVANGDVAVVPLSVPAGQTVNVTVGNETGYGARLAVQDDGDGNVTLLVNTYLAGSLGTDASDTYRAVGNDTTTVLDAQAVVTLAHRSYPVTARTDGEIVDEQSLTVTDPVFGNVSAYRALPRVFGATNASEMRTAERNGSLEPLRSGDPPSVVEGETLVLAVDAPSLLGVVASRPGNTTTDRVLALHRVRSTVPTHLEIMGPCGGIALRRAAERGKFRAITDHRDGVVYLLLDTDDLIWNVGHQSFYLDIGPQSRLTDGTELKRDLTFQTGGTRPRTVQTGDPTARLPPSEAVTVRGRSDILPGSRITVSLRYANTDDHTTVARTNTTVAENGTFSATFDLSQASERRQYGIYTTGRQPSIATEGAGETTTTTATETDTATATGSGTTTTTETMSTTTTPIDSESSTNTTETTTRQTKTTAESEPGTTTADGPGFGGLLALAAVSAGIVLLVRRR